MPVKWDYKVIRDPIYGYIGLTQEEVKLIDTPPFQRLRRVKQLANTDLVYPGATHTRFEHSLGCLFVADRIAQKLRFSDDNRRVIRYAALLHDLGHGPFSHVFENILEIANGKDIDHAQITVEIIKLTDIGKILGELVGQVLSILGLQAQESLLRELISGSLDVDKLDYLIRDSNYTGVAYGIFDLERIIHTMNDVEGKHLVIKEKGTDALVSYKLARSLMHAQVYQHHVRLISDSMLTRAAKLAFEENVIDPNQFIFNKDLNVFVGNYLKYDDFEFLKVLESKPNTAKNLVLMLKNRNLLKRGYEKRTSEIPELILRKLNKMTRVNFEQMEIELAKKINTDPNLIIVYIQRIGNPLYRDPERYTKEEGEILIEMNDGRIVSFDTISPLTGTVDKYYIEKFFVFCPDNQKKQINTAVEEYLNNLA